MTPRPFYVTFFLSVPHSYCNSDCLFGSVLRWGIRLSNSLGRFLPSLLLALLHIL